MEIQAIQNTALTAASLDSLYDRYIAYLDASPKTIDTYTKALRQFFNYLREHSITNPVREDVLAYRKELESRLAAASVQSYIIAVRLFFRWTAQEGLYPNIADHVKGAKVSKEHKKDYLNGKQVKAIIKNIKRDTPQGRRDYAIFVLMVTGGLRDIEVHRANIEDLRTVGDSTVLFLQGKGREDRADYVKIPPKTEEAIRASLADRKGAKGEEPLFISLSNNSYGSRISTRSISKIAKETMKSSGYDSNRLTAHSLRHTAVTISLLQGNSLEEARQFARHSNIATTMIYNHALDREKNNCSNSIAKAIF